LLLLNIPPNKRGLFSEQDVKSLYEFRSILDETFKTNLAKGRLDDKLTDQELKTFLTLKAGESIEFELEEDITFDRVALQENIAEGQRNEEAVLEYLDGDGWKAFGQVTTIGYKRLLKTPLITTNKIRFTVKKAI